ncbi:MAG: adenosylcobinamide-phosphate synthase [Halocynthiibacter sp.]|jgi:adenosylcobinamide-phosphate synthase
MIIVFALAAALDALLGEPKWIWSRAPHPAVLMGRLISRLEIRFNDLSHAPKRRKLLGIAVMLALVLGTGALGLLLKALPTHVAEVLVLAILLAQRSLVDHLRDVAKGLRNSLKEGRDAVAMIVGRDTADMDGAAVARAAIESGAENFSDGVIAPAFWFLIGGLPGLLIYKITNTADSMVGYRTPRLEAFGWAAARFDDLLNLIPARLSAVLIAYSGPRDSFRGVYTDAKLHRSPNAGWPEAAMARTLGVALSGPRSYEGEMREFPWVNEGGDRAPGAPQIEAAIAQLWRAWTLGLFTAVAALLIAQLLA